MEDERASHGLRLEERYPLHLFAAAKSLQSCPTLCDPIDGSPPASPIPGILQARTLEWVAISFSNAWKSKEKVKSLSCVWLLATPWTAAHQAPLSMDFPGKSTGVGCHCLLHTPVHSPSTDSQGKMNYSWDKPLIFYSLFGVVAIVTLTNTISLI